MGSVHPFPGGSSPQIGFTRAELKRIIDLYGRMVAAGLWKDYAVEFGRDHAAFWAFRRSAEQARGAYSPNTERALRTDLLAFQAWCAANDVHPLPASAETVLAFIDAMAATKAPASVRRYVSSIATAHRMADEPNPAEMQAVELALKACTGRKAAPSSRPPGSTRPMVE